MNYPLFVDMEAKLKDDLDMNEETFVQPDEMIGYFNEAVSMIETQIHTMAEDYFLSVADLPIVTGESDVQLPSNIYANKIRKLQWNVSANEKYELLPIKDLNDIPWVRPNDPYMYMLLNNGVTATNTIGTVIRLYPASRTTLSTGITCYYIRGANRYEDDTSVCDIPEFSNMIIQYVRHKILFKEGNPMAESDLQDFQRILVNMIESLRSRTMDENTRLSLDPRVLAEYADFQEPWYWSGFYW